MIEFDVSDYTNINPAQYVNEKRKLQIELLKLQKWVISQKKNIAIVFEGRDTAGKTGSISVLSRYLIPSNFRLVKFGIPTKNESRNWFKRYENTLPKTGEIVFYDRSWYTRALVEITLGYCSKSQYAYFMKNVVEWEKKLINKDTTIIKLYLSINKDIQQKRFKKRISSPLVHWKVSQTDMKMLREWDSFTFYKNEVFNRTSHKKAPWIILNSNIKMVAVLNAFRYVLGQFDYPNKKISTPRAWSKNLKSYQLKVNNVLFSNLTFEQYHALKGLEDTV
ncbi:MAG: polyphosphate kinase [Gammaproteobacteria bacterium]|nr:polyphosphate kinase [Gammaproteobacteria bacterium]|tara:strand:+ start:7181 stop:8014 length:834 start_codon:yes stop_codon:yes gene_type:complete